MKDNTGKKGEEIVCRWLTDHGHTILERNWRYGHLEIDIISYDRSGIHFVEVKSRKTPFEAEPQDCVTTPKPPFPLLKGKVPKYTQVPPPIF